MVPSPLLPRLHTLYVSSLPANGNHAVLYHIISASLRFVEVSSFATAAFRSTRTFTTYLLSQAPDLHHFHVGDPDMMPKDVQDDLFSFRQLRTLRLTSLSRKLFWPICVLNELPNLRMLLMDLSSQRTTALDLNSGIPCQSVKVLHITWRVSPLFDLLAALETPNLCELHLTFLQNVGETAVRSTPGDSSLLGAVAKWSSTLRTLNIDMTQSTRPRIFRDSKWPLLQFEHLQSMEVHASHVDGLLDSTPCWELARSFPNIKSLSLPLSVRISFRSLLALVFLCPHLRYLQVGINTISSLEVFSTTMVFPNDLQTISVGDTTALDHFTLARSLIISFPNLVDIVSPSPSWSSVNDLLRFAHSLEMARPRHETVSHALSLKHRNRMVQDPTDCQLPEELRLPWRHVPLWLSGFVRL
ncbi:hypothetical protein BDN72DRAFT_306183 [Pluteus cervinus]|uniref:Uncharacterized protein n=1 Tax=Pluteus cervinus TaxID=181527 RepID=A0ACD3AFQ5_9AGAR|nr:hypothetical protein BDN72DRAFT_306183 [Pluteus cervinus]